MLESAENDSFDKLLLALGEEGFALPYSASVRNYPNVKDLVEADKKAWQDNRTALIKALTDSGWVAA